MEQAADTQASAIATMNVANLTGVIECRATIASAMTVTTPVASVAGGVTDVVTRISSALQRMRPAFCHTAKRRSARIRFQPRWRANSAALAVTRPSSWGRSQGCANSFSTESREKRASSAPIASDEMSSEIS